MEVSTMIGTEIFSPTGEKLGYVKTVYLSKDRKKITCLLCVDEGEENEADDEFVMPFRAVLSVKDVIIAKKARIAKTTGSPAPVGIQAYSDAGEALGLLCEILVGDGGPVYIVTKDGVRTSYPDGAVTIGEALMISSDNETGEKASGGKTGRVKKERKENKTENDSPEESGAEPVADSAVRYDAGDFAAVANAAGGSGLDRLNLLGRQVKITVRDKNGDPIALSGEKITPEILSKARRNNLLLRLTVNTLTNLV